MIIGRKPIIIGIGRERCIVGSNTSILDVQISHASPANLTQASEIPMYPEKSQDTDSKDALTRYPHSYISDT